MAVAPGHLLGQQIGNVLETAVKPVLEAVAQQADLFLDSKGPRQPVRKGQLVSWPDGLGNSHDLDFVLERGGRGNRQGTPAAFVEIAWRRYTKHSKAKAQEIQAAVLPLLAAWSNTKPVPAAVVAGEWTSPALKQLRSTGFEVCHLSFSDFANVFHAHGIDIFGDKDSTPDGFWLEQVDKLRSLGGSGEAKLAADLREGHKGEFSSFANALVFRLTRMVASVSLTPLYGQAQNFSSVEQVLEALEAIGRGPLDHSLPLVRYVVRISYTNGDSIDASFNEQSDLTAFLDSFT